MAPADRPRLAPADALKREVQAALRADDGSLSNARYAGGPGRFDGYGYVAAEAYWHLAGGRESGLRSMQLLHRGTSRWWLEDAEGRVIDLALGRGEKPDFPYERGSRAAVPRHEGGHLARRRRRSSTRCSSGGKEAAEPASAHH